MRMPIANVEAEGVTGALAWIITTCETEKPANIPFIQYNPIAAHFRKVSARQLGLQELRTLHSNAINSILLKGKVHANNALEVYTNNQPNSRICREVARSMARSIFQKKLYDGKIRSYEMGLS